MANEEQYQAWLKNQAGRTVNTQQRDDGSTVYYTGEGDDRRKLGNEGNASSTTGEDFIRGYYDRMMTPDARGMLAYGTGGTDFAPQSGTGAENRTFEIDGQQWVQAGQRWRPDMKLDGMPGQAWANILKDTPFADIYKEDAEHGPLLRKDVYGAMSKAQEAMNPNGWFSDNGIITSFSKTIGVAMGFTAAMTAMGVAVTAGVAEGAAAGVGATAGSAGGAVGGSAGGAFGAGGAAAADAAGLAQMANTAGLTGAAADSFVASGGVLGSTAAGGGGVGTGLIGSDVAAPTMNAPSPDTPPSFDNQPVPSLEPGPTGLPEPLPPETGPGTTSPSLNPELSPQIPNAPGYDPATGPFGSPVTPPSFLERALTIAKAVPTKAFDLVKDNPGTALTAASLLASAGNVPQTPTTPATPVPAINSQNLGGINVRVRSTGRQLLNMQGQPVFGVGGLINTGRA